MAWCTWMCRTKLSSSVCQDASSAANVRRHSTGSRTRFAVSLWECAGEHLYQRADDAPDTVRARLATYHRQTEPVIDYYRLINLLVTVPGQGSVDEVKERRSRPSAS